MLLGTKLLGAEMRRGPLAGFEDAERIDSCNSPGVQFVAGLKLHRVLLLPGMFIYFGNCFVLFCTELCAGIRSACGTNGFWICMWKCAPCFIFV